MSERNDRSEVQSKMVSIPHSREHAMSNPEKKDLLAAQAVDRELRPSEVELNVEVDCGGSESEEPVPDVSEVSMRIHLLGKLIIPPQAP